MGQRAESTGQNWERLSVAGSAHLPPPLACLPNARALIPPPPRSHILDPAKDDADSRSNNNLLGNLEEPCPILRLNLSTEADKTIHRRVNDQIKNFLSGMFVEGHVAEALQQNVITERFIYALVHEKDKKKGTEPPGAPNHYLMMNDKYVLLS